VGDATGSSVGNGSGTMLPQTTLWNAVLIKFQAGRKKAQKAQKNFPAVLSQPRVVNTKN
jgi:hypothetical protein